MGRDAGLLTAEAASLDWDALIRDVADFPRPGVLFKDITPLLADGASFAVAIRALAEPFLGRGVEVVVGIEARGFIVAAPVALALDAGFVPARKSGKLPWQVASEPYALEYGEAALEVHRDALRPGQRVAVLDDVLATGGTAAAVVRLVEELGGEVVGLGFLIELLALAGRDRLVGREIFSLKACT